MRRFPVPSRQPLTAESCRHPPDDQPPSAVHRTRDRWLPVAVVRWTEGVDRNRDTETFAEGVLAVDMMTSGDALIFVVLTREVIRDMDVMRSALGDERLTYLDYSYGTRIGTTYAELFPAMSARWLIKFKTITLPALASTRRNTMQSGELRRPPSQSSGFSRADCFRG
jgi:hypothetical protein